MDILKIGGVVMPIPSYEGVKSGYHKVWSANTGRTASGKMEGTLIAKKRTYEINFPPLTFEQAKKVEKAVGGDYFNVTLTNGSDVIFSGEMYAGDTSYTIYSLARCMPYTTDMAISLIER